MVREFCSHAPRQAGQQQNCQTAIAFRGAAQALVELTSNHCERFDARLGHSLFAALGHVNETHSQD